MIFLDDYFESIEYVPIELRQGFTSIRELDLQVHNAMDSLDKNFKEFFGKIHSLTSQQQQDQYSRLLVKCDEVMTAASDKVKVADNLHELIEKCRRHLDIGLEKLREDLKDGDKADIIEELERRSKEEDELYRLEQEKMIAEQKQLQQQLLQKKQQLSLTQTTTTTTPTTKATANNNYKNKIYSQNQSNNSANINNKTTNFTTPRLNSTNSKQQSSSANSNPLATNQKQAIQKKREKKRLNNSNINSNNMSIFNSNSNANGASFSQSDLEYLNSLTPTNSQSSIKNNLNSKFNSCHMSPTSNLNKKLHPNVSQHQLIRTNQHHNNISKHYHLDSNNSKFNNIKNRGNINQHHHLSLTPQHHAHINNSQLLQSSSSSTIVKDKNQHSSQISRANQQISLISAITAVNAVSPTPSFSDKKMISSNPNGDILATSVINMNKISPLATANLTSHTSSTTKNTTLKNLQQVSATGLVSNTANIAYNQSTSQGGLINSGGASTSSNRKQYSDKNYQMSGCRSSGDSYPPSTTPSNNTNMMQNSSLSASHLHSCNDPIVAAASQAINATQQMQQGRRTSSLKASYAAVNSGSLQNISGGMLMASPQHQQSLQHPHLFQQDGSSNNSLSSFNYDPYNLSQQQDSLSHQAFMMNSSMIHGQSNLDSNRVPPLHISLKGPRGIKKLKQHQQQHEISPNGSGVYNFEDFEGDSSSHSESIFGSNVSPKTPTKFDMRHLSGLGSLSHHPLGQHQNNNDQQMVLHNHQGSPGMMSINDIGSRNNASNGGLLQPEKLVYCYCRKYIPEVQMIGCDNESKCPIEWFHMECVGITKVPDGKWFCDACKADLAYRSQR